MAHIAATQNNTRINFKGLNLLVAEISIRSIPRTGVDFEVLINEQSARININEIYAKLLQNVGHDFEGLV